MNANEKIHLTAWDLRTELFNLVNKFKSLEQKAAGTDGFDDDERSQLDSVACQLASIHAALPYVFVAATNEN